MKNLIKIYLVIYYINRWPDSQSINTRLISD